LQADGTGNIENELFMILYQDRCSTDDLVYVRNKCLATQYSSGTAKWLYEALKLNYVGPEEY